MKALLMVIFLAVSALAETSDPPTHTGSCGPADVRFDVDTSPSKNVAPREPGKALIYVIQQFEKLPGELGKPTLRVGLDGAWVGANHGNSYSSFAVQPGEHHMCVNWQSRFKELSQKAGFSIFTAEEGKVYYFRARVTERSNVIGGSSENVMVHKSFSLELHPINNDEGQFLIASSKLATARRKQ